MDITTHGGGGRVGETVEEALRRLQSEPALPALGPEAVTPAAREARWMARFARLLSAPIQLERRESVDDAPVWVRSSDPQTVAQALGARPLAPVEVPSGPAAEDALVERLSRWWKPVAVVAASVALVVTVAMFRALAPHASAAAPSDLPSDPVYLAEVSQEIQSRCVTWQQELHDAEELLASSNLEPVRMTLRADDVFAGTRHRPQLLIEGTLKDAEAPSPLRLPARGELAVRKFHDRNARGGVTRVIEASW